MNNWEMPYTLDGGTQERTGNGGKSVYSELNNTHYLVYTFFY